MNKDLLAGFNWYNAVIIRKKLTNRKKDRIPAVRREGCLALHSSRGSVLSEFT